MESEILANLNLLSDNELADSIEELQKNRNLLDTLLQERHRREQDAYEQEEEEQKNKLLNTSKGKKLIEKYKKKLESLKANFGDHTLKLTFDVVFEFSTTMPDESDLFDGCVNICQRSKVNAKLVKADGLNKERKAIIQEGLNWVAYKACSDIYDLFPITVVHNKLIKEISDIVHEFDDYGVDYEDLRILLIK